MFGPDLSCVSGCCGIYSDEVFTMRREIGCLIVSIAFFSVPNFPNGKFKYVSAYQSSPGIWSWRHICSPSVHSWPVWSTCRLVYSYVNTSPFFSGTLPTFTISWNFWPSVLSIFLKYTIDFTVIITEVEPVFCCLFNTNNLVIRLLIE